MTNSESDRAELEKLRSQLHQVQEELHESLFTVEKSAHAMRQKEREHYQVESAVDIDSYERQKNCISGPLISAHLIFFLNALQTAQADTHKKIVQAVDERDILHEADVRAAQEQYSREMANIREELMEARKR